MCTKDGPIWNILGVDRVNELVSISYWVLKKTNNSIDAIPDIPLK